MDIREWYNSGLNQNPTWDHRVFYEYPFYPEFTLNVMLLLYLVFTEEKYIIALLGVTYIFLKWIYTYTFNLVPRAFPFEFPASTNFKGKSPGN